MFIKSSLLQPCDVLFMNFCTFFKYPPELSAFNSVLMTSRLFWHMTYVFHWSLGCCNQLVMRLTMKLFKMIYQNCNSKTHLKIW